MTWLTDTLRKLAEILNKLWSKVVGSKSDRDFLFFLLALVFASIAWYVNALKSERERKLEIGVKYSNVPDNICFSQPLPDKIDLTMKGSGKSLRGYNRLQIDSIEIDLSSQITSTNGHIHIVSEQLKRLLTDHLIDDTDIKKMEPNFIDVDYFSLSSKKIPVSIAGSLQPAQQFFFTKKPVVFPDSVIAYGKLEMLDSISFVKTVPLSEQNIRDTFNTRVPLSDIEGISFSVHEVNVSAVAEQYTEKRLIIDIETMNVPTGEELRLFPSTAEVTFHIALSDYNQITENDIRLLCYYPQSQTNTLQLEWEYSTSLIWDVRVNPTKVEYIIEK